MVCQAKGNILTQLIGILTGTGALIVSHCRSDYADGAAGLYAYDGE